MENLLIILGVLVLALFIILPLIEKTSKPLDPDDEEQQAQLMKKANIMRFLMMFLALAAAIKYFFV
ncbi:MAG: hypothetical protein HRU20_02425 [Pseudomonadales bacterium]|nr:hypothetical protein [Pseudomonadales bacterium]